MSKWRTYTCTKSPWSDEGLLDKLRTALDRTIYPGSIPVTLLDDDPTAEWIAHITDADWCGQRMQVPGTYTVMFWSGSTIAWSNIYIADMLMQVSIEGVERVILWHADSAKRQLGIDLERADR